MKGQEVIDALNKAKQDIELQTQYDTNYIKGRLDGWNQAINFMFELLSGNKQKEKVNTNENSEG